MDSGYYATTTGLVARMEALDVAANNLANVGTTGYKAQQEFYGSFAAGLRKFAPQSLNRAINDYGVLGGTVLDLGNGTLERTGNDLDLAVEGPGFFVVQTKAGMRYTRNGGLRADSSGDLVTSSGDRVMGEAGPILMTGDPVSVSEDGTITQKGAILARLQLVSFEPRQLSPEGNSLYKAASGAGQPVASPVVRQGMLESSNQSPIASSVRLTLVQRQAGLLQRAFSIFNDDFNRTAAEVIARV